MQRLFFAILLVCMPTLAGAIDSLTVAWEGNTDWLSSGNDSSYVVEGFGSGSLKHRIGVQILNRDVVIAEVWDKPSDRQLNTSVDLATVATARITGRATAYAAPWQPLTAYSLGDKISVSDYPLAFWWMAATRAGTSGATEPVWPEGHGFKPALQKTLRAAAAVDKGSGIVALPLPLPASGEVTHLFTEGDSIIISGTTNYNGTTTLPSQSASVAGELFITHTYVAETFLGTETIILSGASAIDNGDGTVGLPCQAHTYEGGEAVTITGTTGYNGSYTLAAQSNPDVLKITATYVAENMAGGMVIAPVVEDPDGSGVQWTFTTGTLETGITEPTGRMMGKMRDGKIVKVGNTFHVRTAP